MKMLIRPISPRPWIGSVSDQWAGFNVYRTTPDSKLSSFDTNFSVDMQGFTTRPGRSK